MTDTIQVVKNVVKDPVPIVNTGVLFGLTAMEWEMLLTIMVALASVVWTVMRIINEYYKLKYYSNERKKNN